MANQSVLVRVPATVGNFGGATNCAALALDAPLNVKVTPRSDGEVAIRYFGEHGERVPPDRSNLAVQALEAALDARGVEFPGADFAIFSSVPVAVGLGSSTAAILAGVIAADQLFHLSLQEKDLLELAGRFEDRQDNLRASWLGGFVASLEEAARPTYRRTPVAGDFALHVVVPETALAKKPWHESLGTRGMKSVDSSGHERAAAFGEFFADPSNGHGATLGDPLHSTCEKKVPGLEEALALRLPGVLSIFACGSGPAVGILAQSDALAAVAAVRECFARHGVDSLAGRYRPTNAGARDWNAVRPDIMAPPLRGRSVPSFKFPYIPA
jgi:homoserine kinase